MDVRFEVSEDGMIVHTVGMEAAGLPNVARSMPLGAALQPLSEPMVALVQEMLSRSWHPQNGERLMHSPAFVLRRVQGAVWMHPTEPHDADLDRRARYRFGLARAVEIVVKTSMLASDPVGPLYRVDHFRGFSTTNGLGLEGGHELSCFTERTGPRVTHVLSTLGDLLATAKVNDFDRVAHPAPMYGIAGHVLWPIGHMEPMDDGPKVSLFDALPLEVSELQDFRHDGEAQKRWIDARYERRDVHVIRARWGRLFDGAPTAAPSGGT